MVLKVEPTVVQDNSIVMLESLGSWLQRFCECNGILKLASIFSYEFNRSRLVYSSLDTHRDFQLTADEISCVTGTPTAFVSELLLCNLMRALNGDNPRCKGQWIKRCRAHENRNVGLRHAVCPLCVGGRAEPMWLQHWRLTVSTACVVHQVMLLDECPQCRAPFVTNIGIENLLSQCAKCQLPIASMPVKTCHPEFKVPSFVANLGRNTPQTLPVFQAFQSASLQQLPNLRAQEFSGTDQYINFSEHHWWQGIRKIFSFIGGPNRAQELRRQNLPAEFDELLNSIHSRGSFDQWNLMQRHTALRFAEWLTTEWPERFIRFLTSSRENLLPDTALRQPGPPWIQQVVNKIHRYERPAYCSSYSRLLP
jgi:hypothetical protein